MFFFFRPETPGVAGAGVRTRLASSPRVVDAGDVVPAVKLPGASAIPLGAEDVPVSGLEGDLRLKGTVERNGSIPRMSFGRGNQPRGSSRAGQVCPAVLEVRTRGCPVWLERGLTCDAFLPVALGGWVECPLPTRHLRSKPVHGVGGDRSGTGGPDGKIPARCLPSHSFSGESHLGLGPKGTLPGEAVWHLSKHDPSG